MPIVLHIQRKNAYSSSDEMSKNSLKEQVKGKRTKVLDIKKWVILTSLYRKDTRRLNSFTVKSSEGKRCSSSWGHGCLGGICGYVHKPGPKFPHKPQVAYENSGSKLPDENWIIQV